MPHEDIGLRIAGTVEDSIVDGPGIRYVIFVQGCPHHCPGCHNPETHDFAGGSVADLAAILARIAGNPLLAGVTFSGGEPFCQAEALVNLARKILALPRSRPLNFMVYSGYTYEELLQQAKTQQAVGELLGLCAYLVDGPYIEAQRNLTLRFRGSANQRVIDLQATRRTGELTLYREDYY